MSGSAKEFEHLRNRTVVILTPVYREPSWHYTQSLLTTVIAFEQLGIRFGVKQVVGDAHLARARNQLVASFLAAGAADAVFIDADMEWQPDAVLRLLSSQQLVIGAACRRRQQDIAETDPRSWCIRLIPASAHELKEHAGGPLEVEGTGTGFLRVNRQVFDRLMVTHPDWKAPGSDFMTPEERKWYYRFFRFPENDDLGEDYFFCRAWREIGGSIWIDPQLSVGHVGTYVYRGSVRSLFTRVS